MRPKIVIDLDGTLTIDDKDVAYPDKRPNLEVIEKLRAYAQDGYGIVIHTARNMRTYKGNLGEINVHTLPVILEWLAKHAVPYDEVVVGKVWCGHGGFYVDDRAIRPDEFARLSAGEIEKLLGSWAPQ
ncbi:HAD hydrolase family protein [Epibacterium ulvae]|nr:HAD hydrolase family protein [Epibacterium ulvae]